MNFFSTLKYGVVAALFWGGIAFLIFGYLLTLMDQPLAVFVGDIFVKIASAVLGAGVFAAIMKSSQFTTIFQQHIFDVFNDPKKLGEIVDLPTRWRVLTESRLKDVLPEIYEGAAKLIDEGYFDDELDFHYEQFEVIYDLQIDENGNIKVLNTFSAIIIKNPKLESCEFKQVITAKDNDHHISLLDFEVSNVSQPDLIPKIFTNSEESPEKYTLSYTLPNNQKAVSIRRTFEYTQSLKKDPWINVTIGRYIKGAVVVARVSEGYDFEFVSTGFNSINRDTPPSTRADGFKVWSLASQTSLLLPGQGFILIPIAKK